MLIKVLTGEVDLGSITSGHFPPREAAAAHGWARARAAVEGNEPTVDLDGILLPDRDAAIRDLQGRYRTDPEISMLAHYAYGQVRPALARLAGEYLLALAGMDDPLSTVYTSSRYAATLALRKLLSHQIDDLIDSLLFNGAAAVEPNHQSLLRAWLDHQDGNSRADAQLTPDQRRCVEDLERFHSFATAARNPRPGRTRDVRAPEAPASARQPATPSPVTEPVPSEPHAVPSRPDASTSKEFRTPGAEVERANAREPRRSATPLISKQRERVAHLCGEPAAEGVVDWEIDGNPIDAGPQASRWPTQRLPPGHHELRARRTAAQGLLFADPVAIREADIALLLSRISRPDCLAATRAIAATVLYTMRVPNSLTQIRVVATLADADPESDSPILVLDPLSWVAPLHAIADLPKAGKGVHVVRTPALYLPLSSNWRGVAALVTHARARVGSRLFTEAEVASADLWVRAIRRDTTTSLSLSRLPMLMRHELMAIAEDESLVALLAGDLLAAHLRVRFYYHQTTPQALGEIFVTAAARVSARLRGSDELSVVPAHPWPGVVGSLRCPALSDVQTWVAALLKSQPTPPVGRPSFKNVRSFHNAYVCYVSQMLLWATGVRPHAKGLQALVPLGRLMAVDEKDKGTSALRVVPVPTPAQRQWQLYETHRSWVLNLLNLKSAPPFFLIGARGTISELSASATHENTGNPFESNAHRHFYSSNLRRCGLKGAHINSLMGHSAIGEEGGGRHRMISTGLVAGHLVGALDLHVQSMGWAAREGFGRG